MADDKSIFDLEQGAPSEPANENDPAADRETFERELMDLRDKYLRAVAESENLRKRAERETADARTYGIAGFARDMLAVADNLNRALEVVGAEARAKADGPLQALIDGVELTARELQRTLEKHKVRKLEPLGEKFDPHFHQAMFEMPAPDKPAGTVVQVIQPGYAIGERVLRPALVAVAKGGPKPGTPADSEASADDRPD